MLNFTVLGTLFLVLVVSTLWIIQVIKKVGRVLYYGLLPSSKTGPRKPLDEDKLPTLSHDLQQITMPWGWRASGRQPNPKPVELPANSEMRQHPVPWGWPGNPQFVWRHHNGDLIWRVTMRIRSEILAFNMDLAYDRTPIIAVPMLPPGVDSGEPRELSGPEFIHSQTVRIPWGW